MAETDTTQATVHEVLKVVRGAPDDAYPAQGWEARAIEALTIEEAQDAPRKTLVTQLKAMLGAAAEERPAFETYPARPYWEAVNPAAFPDGLPPDAVAPDSEESTDG